MTRSMTGFSRHSQTGELGTAVWELRAVNHRYLEVNFRLPEMLRGLEPRFKALLQEHLQRGKIDCSLRYEPSGDASLTLNKPLLEKLIAAQKEILTLYPEGKTANLLKWPGVLQSPEPNLNDLTPWLLDGLTDTVKQLIETRQSEGKKLQALLNERLTAMPKQLAIVEKALPEILQKQREKWQDRLKDLMSNGDEARLEQEVVVFAQRMDIAEEIDRLNAHLEEVSKVLTQDNAMGRRLDFLMQELNREANTIASKSVAKDTTHAAVELKVLIEQMREQVQNIE